METNVFHSARSDVMGQCSFQHSCNAVSEELALHNYKQCLKVIARLQTCKCGLWGMKALLVSFALLWHMNCCGGECAFYKMKAYEKLGQI